MTDLGPPAVVRTPVGELGTAAEGLTVGGAVSLCIRPEQVRIAPVSVQADKCDFPLPATIESETFLGETRQFVVSLPGEVLWKVTCLTPASEGLAAGQNVQLLIAPRDVAVLPA